MASSLKTTTFKNIGFNAVAKVVALFFSALTSLILARILVPNDYGIVGFALIFVNLLAQFNDFGINSAVVRKKELDEQSLYTGFTIKTILGIIVFVLSYLIAPLSTHFFDDGAVVNVIRMLSLNFLLTIFVFLPSIQLTRELNYKKLALSQIIGSLVSSATSVLLALNGFKYWSIVISNLCAATVALILLNLIKPLKVMFKFNKAIALEFIRYSRYLFFSVFLVFVIFNADNFIVGAVSGSRTLGYYALAFNWGAKICELMSAVILTVLLPTFSKIQDNKDKIKEAYLQILEVVAFLSILANLSLFISSREFLFVVLGHSTEKWLPALPALKIFCIYGIFRSLLEPVASVMMVIGRTDLLFKANLLASLIEITFLYPVLKRFGIEGVAILVTISYVSQYLIYFPILHKEIKLNVRGVVNTIKPSFISGLVVLICSELFLSPIKLQAGKLYLGLKLLTTVIGFIGLHGILTKWNMLKEVKSLINRKYEQEV